VNENIKFSQFVSQMANVPAYRTHLLKAMHDGLTQKKNNKNKIYTVIPTF